MTNLLRFHAKHFQLNSNLAYQFLILDRHVFDLYVDMEFLARFICNLKKISHLEMESLLVLLPVQVFLFYYSSINISLMKLGDFKNVDDQ